MTIQGQPSLSAVVNHINAEPSRKSLLAGVHTAPEIVQLLAEVDGATSVAAKEFARSTLLFHDLESGRKVIAALCSGIAAAADLVVDVQLLRSIDSDYHLGHRNTDEGMIVFYVSVPAGRWCPATTDH